jgi:integrase/recombinase XerD
LLTAFVISMREQVSPVTCNIAIRGFNVFLTWLHENGHIAEPLKVKQVKAPKRIPEGLTDTEISRLVSYKGKTFGQQRMGVLLCLLLDCGLRIDEALSLQVSDLDFENLLVKVRGKGDKERIVPFSMELRKVLYRWVQHKQRYVFPTRSGTPLAYYNAIKEFQAVCDSLGIKHKGFHSCRRSFALNFIRQGGSPFMLQRILGHSSITVTQVYVNLQMDDLKGAQQKTSVISRLRRG